MFNPYEQVEFMMDREYTLKHMIIFWSKRLIEAIEEDDMAAAYDIQTNTLPKTWKLYKEHIGERIVEEK
jgi:hypothetical protein|tara:strand:- start:300 stop:506 length:207 start_codon:yes stop_codon:yes gene_type:complete